MLVLWVCLFPVVTGQFVDWSVLGGRANEPTCVDIPTSMTLCSDIGYDKMRLPNLLGHDTLAEVQQQSGSWVPLLQIKCHPYTKLFLCSLFTPVCLENEIFPCRSLCQSVQTGCEERINNYGYKWPDMLNCDKFPVDNDMCIKPFDEEVHQNVSAVVDPLECKLCEPVETYENILDNFCRSDFVMRTRVKQQKRLKLKLRKTKVYKNKLSTNKIINRKLKLSEDSSCCSLKSGSKYLIMGKFELKNPKPTFIVKWSRSKELRKAVRMFKSLQCNDPNLFKPNLDDGLIIPTEPKSKKKKSKKKIKNKKQRRKNKKNRRRGKKNKKKNKAQDH